MRRVILVAIAALVATLVSIPAAQPASAATAFWQLSPANYLQVVSRVPAPDADVRFVTGNVGSRYVWFCNQYTNGAAGGVLNQLYDEDWIVSACIVQSQQNKIAYQAVTLFGYWNTFHGVDDTLDVTAQTNWAKEGVIYTGNTCSSSAIAATYSTTMSRRYECWTANQYGKVGDTVQAYSKVKWDFADGLQHFPDNHGNYFDIFGPSIILG